MPFNYFPPSSDWRHRLNEGESRLYRLRLQSHIYSHQAQAPVLFPRRRHELPELAGLALGPPLRVSTFLYKKALDGEICRLTVSYLTDQATGWTSLLIKHLRAEKDMNGAAMFWNLMQPKRKTAG